MNNTTAELTNMLPGIQAFQNQLRAKYDLANQSVLPGQIDFVGSSLMEIFPIERFQREQDLQLDRTIYNRGVRATTTADVLAHMDTLIFDLKPSKLFLNIGSNDIGFNVPEAVFLANYRKILTQVRTQLPTTQIFVMAFFPINEVADFGENQHEHGNLYQYRSNERLLAANAKLKPLAESHGAEFLELSAGLSDDSGNLRKELSFDGTHLLPAGYQIVLNNMLPYLR